MHEQTGLLLDGEASAEVCGSFLGREAGVEVGNRLG
jgi:hypothetical protein